MSTLLLLTAVAGLLLLASVERVLSALDTYHVLLIARGQPSVNSAGFGLPEQLAPSAQLAMLRAAQGQLRLQRLQLVQQRSWRVRRSRSTYAATALQRWAAESPAFGVEDASPISLLDVLWATARATRR